MARACCAPAPPPPRVVRCRQERLAAQAVAVFAQTLKPRRRRDLAAAAAAAPIGCRTAAASVPAGHHDAADRLAAGRTAPRRGGRRWAPPRAAAARLGSDGLSLEDLRVVEKVGSMAVQTVRDPVGVSLEAPQVETIPGTVNFYSAVLSMGSMTCQLLLKEYPTSTRDLGVNEIRIYEELLGPQEGFFSALVLAARAAESGQGFPSASEAVPSLQAAFEAHLTRDPSGAARLKVFLPEEATDSETTSGQPTAEGASSPSIWLAFRMGEHGTTTLLDHQAHHLSQLRAEMEQELLRRRGETTDDYRANLRSVFSILMPFERVPVDPSQLWAGYARAAMLRAVESLAFVQSRGVAHGSLSAACLLVNTVDHTEAQSLTVRLYNFGFGSLPAVQAEPGQEADVFREDVFNLGLAFMQLLFPRMAQSGTDFRRLAVDVYSGDMSGLAEFVSEEEPWGCALLEGPGWDLLGMMLRREADAEQLLRSPFFR